MPPLAEVVLSNDEREVLERGARRPKSSRALALRCRIVLAAAQGRPRTQIAAQLGCTKSTVGKWRGRFARRGLDGLHDEPRPGKRRSIGDEVIERVIVRRSRSLRRTHTHDYVRNGTTNLYATLDLASGRVIADMSPRHPVEEFRHFLNLIDASVPAHLDVHVVLDNSSTSKRVRHDKSTTPTHYVLS